MSRPQWLKAPVKKTGKWNERFWTALDFGNKKIDQQALNQALSSSKRIYKHDRTTTVARWYIGKQRVILKRYNARNQWHSIKRALRRSRAHRCWQMTYEFQRVGLNVAAPVLMYEVRFGPICSYTYFASHYLRGELLLTSLPSMSTEEKTKVRNAVAEAFDLMRGFRVTHGDLKASNLIWKDGKLYFIDLDAAQKHRFSWTWEKAHQRDKKRFLKNWQDNPELGRLFLDL